MPVKHIISVNRMMNDAFVTFFIKNLLLFISVYYACIYILDFLTKLFRFFKKILKKQKNLEKFKVFFAFYSQTSPLMMFSISSTDNLSDVLIS